MGFDRTYPGGKPGGEGGAKAFSRADGPPLLIQSFQPGNALRGFGSLAGQRVQATQLQVEGIQHASLLEAWESDLDGGARHCRAGGNPLGMEGGGTTLRAEGGMGLSGLEVTPEGMVLIGGFLSGVAGVPGDRGGRSMGCVPGQWERARPRLNCLVARTQPNRESSMVGK